MYAPRTWAHAFINTLYKEGIDTDSGIDTLVNLVSQVKALPGIVSGRTAAEKLENIIRNGMAKTDITRNLELAVRFLILMVIKNMFRHVSLIIKEIKHIRNNRNGIIELVLEYASSSNELTPVEETGIIKAIKKRSGAAEVVLNSRQNPDLIGGYRIRFGDEVIDASVRFQLKNLLTCLKSGQITEA